MSPARTILVTRPAAQAAELVAALGQRRIAAVTVPTVAVDHATAADDLDRMLAQMPGAAWLVLTSANGAEALLTRMAATGIGLPRDTRVAAVGPATASALRAGGIPVDHVPEAYLSVEIAAGLGDIRGCRVVLARADAATPALRDALRVRGAIVDEVVAYRTVEGPADSSEGLHAALHDHLDGAAFTSSSTVRGLLRLASPLDQGRARAVPSFCIGPVTADTARRAGFHVAAVATEHTARGLADAIATHFERGRS